MNPQSNDCALHAHIVGYLDRVIHNVFPLVVSILSQPITLIRMQASKKTVGPPV